VIDLRAVADGVLVARTDPLDVNVTLVLGDDTALVVDTLSTDRQAHELRDAVRAVTALPLTVAVTHFHFDHSFGASVLADGGRPVWGHPRCAAELADRGGHWRARWHREWASAQPDLAAGLATATIQPPDRLVPDAATLDLGGRTVTLSHLGRAHTDGDLVVYVPDADVLIAGDLVEEGNPPDFSDAYPLEWPEALQRLLRMASSSTVVIPGHGAQVGTGFVAKQHEQLAALDWLIRHGHRDGATVDKVAARGPYPLDACRTAVVRGFDALDGA